MEPVILPAGKILLIVLTIATAAVALRHPTPFAGTNVLILVKKDAPIVQNIKLAGIMILIIA